MELTPKDQKLVGTLRAAQLNQGNMQPLPENLEDFDTTTKWMYNLGRMECLEEPGPHQPNEASHFTGARS